MANKQTEYNRGLNAGLQMAYRMLKDSGNEDGKRLIGDEIKKRGVLKISTTISTKEMESASVKIKQLLYETFLCNTLMVLHDEFGYGSQRCLKFLKRWNSKTDCMIDGLVSWQDYVNAISEELKIDVPTEAMKMEGWVKDGS